MVPPLQPLKVLVAVIAGLDSAFSITVPGMPGVIDGKQVLSLISISMDVGRITSTASDNKLTQGICFFMIYDGECAGNGQEVVCLFPYIRSAIGRSRTAHGASRALREPSCPIRPAVS